jgi:hypothetical protein
MKSVFFTLALFCFAYSSCQPPRISDPPFTVGDYIPPLEINKVLNHFSDSLQLSEFKNHLLILDFMSIGCISCLRALSRFDSLQAQFGRRLQFVLVTQDKTDRVAAFMNSNRIGKEIHFPVITEDSILETWFPHQFIAHEVWIYNGKVIAITGGDYVNENNIEIILSGRPLHLPVKTDRGDYNFQRPLLTTDNSGQKNILLGYSAFTNSLIGVPRNQWNNTDSLSGLRRLTMINYPLIGFCGKAFGLSPHFPSAFLMLQVKDSTRFLYNDSSLYKDEWNRQNTFCYELNVPVSVPQQQLNERIQNDINFFFGIKMKMEQMNMQCLVLLDSKDSSPLALSPLLSASVNKPVPVRSCSELVAFLNAHFYTLPVLNESSGNCRMDLMLGEEDLTGLNNLQRQLKKYGLQLVPACRSVEMLVISDR